MPITKTDVAIRRRWPTPPPLTRAAGEAMPDRAVLEEYPDDTGQVLWRALRDVELWRAARGKPRGPLFPRGSAAVWSEELIAAASDPELRGPLSRIAAVRNPRTHPKAGEVAEACRTIAEWAEAQGRYGTALAFMQAAALLEAEDARAAYLTGRLARRRAEYARAESWFYEAISRALESRDWEAYARTFSGLGSLHVQRGNFPMARSCQERAYRIAGKHGLAEMRAMAAHDLFGLSMDAGRVQEAEQYADEARRGYGPGHPLLPSLAHDVAYFWMEQGHFARALATFRAVLPYESRRRERLLTLGAIARTYGALGDRASFEETVKQVRSMAGQAPVSEGLPFTLFSLAQGALSLGDWGEAERLANESYWAATERREAEVQLRAEAIAEAARSHRRMDVEQSTAHTAATTKERERGDMLAKNFVANLTRRAASV